MHRHMHQVHLAAQVDKVKRKKVGEAPDAKPFADIFKAERRTYEVNPNIVSPIPFVSEDALKLCATEKAVKEGKQFYENRQPSIVLTREGYVMADLKDHLPTIKCAPDGRVVSCRCTCGTTDWCSHIVATLMYCFFQPDKVVTEENVNSLLSEIQDHEALSAVLFKILLRMPSRLYTELDTLKKQYIGTKKVQTNDERHEPPAVVDDVRMEWEELLDKHDRLSDAKVDTEKLQLFTNFIRKICFEGQVARAVELAASLSARLDKSVWTQVMRIPPGAFVSRKPPAGLAAAAAAAVAAMGYDDMSDSEEEDDYPLSDEEDDIIMGAAYNYLPGHRPAVSEVGSPSSYPMYYLWRDLVLFATCPFVGLEKKQVDDFLQVAKNSVSDSFHRTLSNIHWHNTMIQDAMTKGECAGGSVALLEVEQEPFLKQRITLLVVIGRLEEALKLAIAAEFHVVAADISMGGWQKFYTNPIKLPGQTVPSRAVENGGDQDTHNPAIQRALNMAKLPAAEAFRMAKSMQHSDFTGAFLIARRGIVEDSQSMRDLLIWIVKELFKLGEGSRYAFNPTNENEKAAKNCVFGLQLLASSKLSTYLNAQPANDIEEVLRSVPEFSQRIVMLDMLVDTLHQVPPTVNPRGQYSYDLYNPTPTKGSFSEVLCDLANFLVKHSFVSHAISFLIVATSRSLNYMHELMKLARSQGPDCFRRTMEQVLPFVGKMTESSQAKQLFTYANACANFGFLSLAIRFGKLYLYKFNQAQAKVALWVIRKAFTISEQKGTKVVKSLMARKKYQTQYTAHLPVIYAVIQNAIQRKLNEQAFEACLALCDSVYDPNVAATTAQNPYGAYHPKYGYVGYGSYSVGSSDSVAKERFFDSHPDAAPELSDDDEAQQPDEVFPEMDLSDMDSEEEAEYRLYQQLRSSKPASKKHYDSNEKSETFIKDNLLQDTLKVAKEITGGVARVEEFLVKKIVDEDQPISSPTEVKAKKQKMPLFLRNNPLDYINDMMGMMRDPSEDSDDDEDGGVSAPHTRSATKKITFYQQTFFTNILLKYRLSVAEKMAKYMICKVWNQLFFTKLDTLQPNDMASRLTRAAAGIALGLHPPQQNRSRTIAGRYEFVAIESAGAKLQKTFSAHFTAIFVVKYAKELAVFGNQECKPSASASPAAVSPTTVKKSAAKKAKTSSAKKASSRKGKTPVDNDVDALTVLESFDSDGPKRQSKRAKKPSSKAVESMDVDDEDFADPSDDEEEVEELPKKRGKAGKATAAKKAGTQRAKRKRAAMEAESDEEAEPVPVQKTPKKAKTQSHDLHSIGELDPSTASVQDLWIAFLVFQFITEPSVNILVDLRKCAHNACFGEASEFQGSLIVDTMMSILSSSHPLKIQILLWDNKIDEAIDIVKYNAEFDKADNALLHHRRYAHYNNYDTAPQQNNDRIQMLVGVMAEVTKKPEYAAKLAKKLTQVVKDYVWRPWAPIPSRYRLPGLNGLDAADAALLAAMQAADWLVNRTELTEVHRVLSGLRGMSIPADRKHYTNLKKALVEAKEVCVQHGRLAEWQSTLEQIRASQANRTACLQILKEL